MNEKQTNTKVLPSKKQKELLTYIDTFISQHGYSPSYREIMSGQGYNSVATVALHVNNLIKRGYLRKRDHSARSLEVVSEAEATKITTNQVTETQEKWLVEKVEHAFSQAENASNEIVESSINNIQILIAALRVLGLEGAAQSFTARLSDLKQRAST
ncbi:MAG: LexA family protein [Candidatus Saccharimonadales bacterium]